MVGVQQVKRLGVPRMMSHGSGIGLACLVALGVGAPLGVAHAEAPRAGSDASRGKVGPDARPRWPGPLATRDQLKVRLRYAKGRLLQQRLRRVAYEKPPKRRRIVGRFLAMVYQGKRLLDVVPFNFPLLAPVENFTATGQHIAERMEANLVTATEVEVPWEPRIDRILVWDVGTDRRWPLDLSSLRGPKAPPAPRAGAPRPAEAPPRRRP